MGNRVKKAAGYGSLIQLPSQSDRSGFTLIELLVVCILISVVLSLVFPDLPGLVASDPLKQSARRLVGFISSARAQSAADGVECFLIVDLDKNSISADCSNTESEVAPQSEENGSNVFGPLMLPDSVSFNSLWRGPDRRYTSGTVYLYINRRGILEPAIINIKRKNRYLGIEVSPFLETIGVTEHILQPE